MKARCDWHYDVSCREGVPHRIEGADLSRSAEKAAPFLRPSLVVLRLSAPLVGADVVALFLAVALFPVGVAVAVGVAVSAQS